MNGQAQPISFRNQKNQPAYRDQDHFRHFAPKFCISFLFCLILSSPVFGQSTIFVDADATGADDGSSWDDAYTNLQDALTDTDLDPGDQIWVAEGIYYPDEGAGQTDNDQDAVFQLINDVEVYGGFAGNETSLNERNWQAHVTILSGDIDGNDTTTGGIITDTDDITGSNSYSVVRGDNTINSARVDGFTITGGKADGTGEDHRNHGGGFFSTNAGDPTVANVIFTGNIAVNGGGMANLGNSQPVLMNVQFIGNEATDLGGGMFNILSHPTLTDVIFSDNYSQNNGGGLFNHSGSSPELVNVLFSGNEAANQAGAILNRDSSSPSLVNVTIVGNISAAGNIGGIYNGASSEATLDNVIIWENFSAGDSDVLSASINTGNGANPTISNSLIAHSGGSVSWNSDIGTNGGGNLDTDPLFVDVADPNGADDILGTPDDGFTLLYNSPPVNSGDNSAVPSGITTDLAGNDRIFDGTPNPDIVDMGAYEFQSDAFGTPDENNVLYVDQNVSGGNGTGSSWVNAIPELRDALTWANENWEGDADGTLQIWVADGIYLPVAVDDPDNVTGSEREATFRLVNDVEIYGGFDGGEPDLNERDWEVNLTILSGDIDGDDFAGPDDNGLTTHVGNIQNDNSYHIVTSSGTDETAALDGFFITAGLADDDNTPDSDHVHGAGIYNEGGSPTLARLHIIGNHAFGLGGGMYNTNGGSPNLTNATFIANRASNGGGGMYNLTDSNPALTNVVFSGNQSGVSPLGINLDGGSGGGMYNNGSSPTLTNTTFTDNRVGNDGGGMHNLDGHPSLTNVTFADNSADIGGGIYNSNSNPTLTGTVFTGNSAVDGGGIANNGAGGSSPSLTNVTFSGNSASDSGGGMIGSNGSNPTLANAIFWGNTAGESGNEIFNTGDSSVNLEFSLYRDRDGESDIVEGGGFTATSSLTDDPLFDNPVDHNGDDDIWGTGDDGLGLTAPSLAINSGNNSLIPVDFTTDLAGNDRIFDGTPPTDRIDMGAYEFQGEPDHDGTGTDNILYVDQNVSGGDGSGSSWDNAMPELRDALSWADDEWDGSNPPLQIWVADGIYHPVSPGNPDNPTNSERRATFSLSNRVEIYGGFDGGEPDLDDRDWETNRTILSGDIDNDDVTDAGGVVIDASDVAGENSYHVVTGSNTDESAVLDGFFITGGLADGGSSGSNDIGAGFYNQSGSPNLTRLHIIGNWAELGGGMVNRTDASPVLTDIIFTGNRGGERGGGGLYNLGADSPTLINVSFRNNRAQTGGGMRNSQTSNPILINVTFSGNQAAAGAGMYNLSSSPTLINVSFSGNRANSFGGGMFSEIRSKPTLINTIFWNNQADGATDTFAASIANLSDSTPTISRSLVANCNPGGNWVSHCGIDGGNNFTNIDPMFIEELNPADAPTLGGDLRLQTDSPVINAGDNSPFESGGVAASVVTDLDGNPRIFAGDPDPDNIDLGAYELQEEPSGEEEPFQFNPDENNVLYVDTNVDTGAGGYTGDGSSWDNAIPILQNALAWAHWYPGTDGTLQLWVADGVYYPDEGQEQADNDRDASFQLADGVELYGGFAGDESSLNERDWKAQLTILSGDIDGNDTTTGGIITDADDISGDNSYSVVTGSSTNNSARLNGFTITGGKSNSGSSRRRQLGGGFYNSNGSPTVANIMFTGNTAVIGAGMGNYNNSDPILTDVVFYKNSAQNHGGGMFNHTISSPTLANVIFSENEAGIRAGAIQNRDSSSPTLVNVTIAGNISDAGGAGGIRNGDESEATYHNVIIWRNFTGGDPDIPISSMNTVFPEGITISNSLIANSGGSSSWNTDMGNDGGGNLDTDPLFVDVDDPDGPDNIFGTDDDGLRLMADSPAIDMGNNSALPSGITTDLAGNPRIFDSGTVDMGAYEFQSETEGDLDLTLTLAEGWRMLASPFDGLTYDDIIGKLWTQGFPGSDYPPEEFPNVFTWPNNQPGNDSSDWVVLGDQGDPVPAGTGFLIQVYADDDYDGTVDGNEEFDKTISLDGTLRTGNVSPPMNTTNAGWTLVGNPYRESVDFSELTSSGLTGVAYVFDSNYSGANGGDTNGNPGGWRSTDGTYGDLVDGIISPAQGFFVQNSGSSGSTTFTESSQTTGGQFYGKQKKLKDFVRLELQGEAGVNAAWIRFSEEGSNERMKGDALELQPYTEQYTLLGARKAGGAMLDIAHFPLPDEQTGIPLSMNATQSGTYTLSATDVDLPPGTRLYLHDRQTGETVLIDEGAEYSFTMNEQATKSSSLESVQMVECSTKPSGGCPPLPKPVQAGKTHPVSVSTFHMESHTSTHRMSAEVQRFLITTTSESPVTELPEKVALGQNYPNPFNPSTVISYQLPATSRVRLEVFDLIGRQVATLVDGTVEAGEYQVSFNAGHLTSGVYLYRLTAHGANGSNKIFTKKLTLIK